MAQILTSSQEAVRIVKSGMTVMVGGFGVCGLPENLLHALAETETSELTIISNNGSVEGWGNGRLIGNGQVRKMYSSYIGENDVLTSKLIAGEIEVELVPQGTLAERIRAGGAGIPAFFTPTGFGTAVADGKESREFNGRGCILETALFADVALIKAYKADRKGNLVFRKTARNFNPVMATAAKITIVEVEEIVENGELQADQIHTPAVYIDYLVKGEEYARRIEKRTNRK